MAVALGEARDLDPLLILAVIGTESSYNPGARSGAGAEGLMQVMTRVHTDKFQSLGGVEKALDPYANMVVGTDILQYLIRRTGGVREGLKWYCGAARMKTDGGYATRVLRELSRLQVAALGQVDNAVILSYKNESGPRVENGYRGEHLGFSRWVKNNERIRGQAAHAGGDALKKRGGSLKEPPAV
ncbi:lytic transglycosylase catalytic subunit [gut metagenome]|uniref:Lytic transglycosylase catalytic subunit n=1 Tax=gut metagenome TaxID=749906 RepID=J9CV47_9ZZZZ